MPQLVNFGVAQFPNYNRVSSSQAIESLREQPTRLFEAKVSPRRCDHGEAWYCCRLTNEVDDRSTRAFIEKIEIVEKQDRSTVSSEIGQEVTSRAIETQLRPHREPSVSCRSVRAECDDRRLTSDPFGEM